jgi:hypothetical protein
MDKLEIGMTLASTKSKAGDANTILATSDDIDALRDKICVYIGPGKAGSNLNGLGIVADDDVIESGHRDVYTPG